MLRRRPASSLVPALVPALVVAALLPGSPLRATASDEAPFRLDSFTCEPRQVDVAALPDGGFLVAWIHRLTDPNGQAGQVERVSLRRFGADLEPLGLERPVTESLANGSLADLSDVAVAATPGGAYAVAWTSGTKGVQARTWDADGTPRSGEVDLGDRGFDLALEAAPDGTFVVAWGGPTVKILRFDDEGRVLHRFDPLPSPVFTATFARDPALAVLTDGRVVVASTVSRGGFPFPLVATVAALYEPGGTRLKDDLGEPPGHQTSLAALPSGGWVWVGKDVFRIVARFFDPTGTPLGLARVVGSYPTDARTSPDVVGLANGTAWVVWEGGQVSTDPGPPPPGSPPLEIVFRRIAAAGPLGPTERFQRALAEESRGAPRAAVLAGSRVLIAGPHGLPPIPVDPEPCGTRLGLLGRAVDTGGSILSHRFLVQVEWHDVRSGDRGLGHPGPRTADTGSFWFFQPDNLELIVKMVDGRTVNNHFWLFYGALSDVGYRLTVTDLVTGEQKRYENPPGRLASFADTFAFRAGSAGLSGREEAFVAPPTEVSGLIQVPAEGHPPDPPGASAAGPCTDPRLPVVARPGLCLQGRRFEVEVTWHDPRSGDSGVGRPIDVNDITGAFWFFSPSNVELVVKVLDGRAVNGRFWVLYGSLTDVEYTLRVRHVLAAPEPAPGSGDEVVFENAPFELRSGADTTSLVPPSERPGGCICPLVIAPVCGFDGVTYGNACLALCEGWVEVEHQGACESPEEDDR